MASTDGFAKLQICYICNDSVHSVCANNWAFRAGAGDVINRNLIPYGSNHLDGCILHRGRGVGVPPGPEGQANQGDRQMIRRALDNTRQKSPITGYVCLQRDRRRITKVSLFLESVGYTGGHPLGT